MLDAREIVPSARQAVPSFSRIARMRRPIVRKQEAMERIFKGDNICGGTRGLGFPGSPVIACVIWRNVERLRGREAGSCSTSPKLMLVDSDSFEGFTGAGGGFAFDLCVI